MPDLLAECETIATQRWEETAPPLSEDGARRLLDAMVDDTCDCLCPCMHGTIVDAPVCCLCARPIA